MWTFRLALAAALMAGLAAAVDINAAQKLVSGCAADHLVQEQFILAHDRRSLVIMQGDGNLVLYDCEGRPLWATNTNCPTCGGNKVVMQADGHLVIYNIHGHAVWANGVYPGAHLGPYTAQIQDDTNFVVYRQGWHPIWASNTQGRYQGTCHVCSSSSHDACAAHILASRETPAMDGTATQWYNYLTFAAWWYQWRVLAVVLVVAAAAAAAVYWRRRQKKAAAKGLAGEYQPLTQTVEYGATAI